MSRVSDNVVIITGESSGELYGSLLAVALRGLNPDVRLYGVGGEKMKQAGVELFSGISSAFGLFEALGSLRAVRETYRRTADALERLSPPVVVLVDYPDFNFRVARAAKRMGIKVLYYVSPQVWAWRSGRVKAMKEFVDRMAVILPFEKAIYDDEGIPCEFVGHPILDEIRTVENNGSEEFISGAGLDASRPLVSLLPGSRPGELKRHLPLLLDALRGIKGEFPRHQFVVPVAPNMDAGRFRPLLEKFEAEGAKVVTGRALSALAASEAAVITSGTAALQAALLGTPFVVIYKMFPLTFHVMRHIVKLSSITLANIVLGRRVAPELIQKDATTDNVISHLRVLLTDTERKESMKESFLELRAFFDGKDASERVARMVAEMSGWQAAGDGGGGGGGGAP